MTFDILNFGDSYFKIHTQNNKLIKNVQKLFKPLYMDLLEFFLEIVAVSISIY